MSKFTKTRLATHEAERHSTELVKKHPARRMIPKKNAGSNAQHRQHYLQLDIEGRRTQLSSNENVERDKFLIDASTDPNSS